MNVDGGKRWRALLTAGVVILLLIVGGGFAWSRLRAAPSLDAPDGRLTNPVWAGDGFVYFSRLDLLADDTPHELWRTRAGARPERIDVFGHLCRAGEVRALHRRPDGRLGLLYVCDDHGRILAMDLTSRSWDVVVDLAGMKPDQLRGIYQITWIPGRLGPIVSSDKYVCAGLGEIHGVEVLPGPVREVDDQRWALGASYLRAQLDCDDLGMAGFVVPIAEHVAVLAAPGAVGRHYDDRSSARWNVYLSDTGPALDNRGGGYRRPGGADGDGPCHIMVAAEGNNGRGLYLHNVRSQRSEKVASGPFEGVSVLPGGAVAVGVEHDGTASYRLRVVNIPKHLTTAC